jgi:hypothetical protein
LYTPLLKGLDVPYRELSCLNSSNPTRKFFTYHAAQAERNIEMITVPELVSQALGSFLTAETKDRFGASHAGLTELLPFAA